MREKGKRRKGGEKGKKQEKDEGWKRGHEEASGQKHGDNPRGRDTKHKKAKRSEKTSDCNGSKDYVICT